MTGVSGCLEDSEMALRRDVPKGMQNFWLISKSVVSAVAVIMCVCVHQIYQIVYLKYMLFIRWYLSKAKEKSIMEGCASEA